VKVRPVFSLKIPFLVVVAICLFIIPSQIEATLSQDEQFLDDQELVTRYAPVLYFHPAELFRPQSVEVLVNTARLRRNRQTWLDVNVLREVSLSDLLEFKDADYNLDAWLGDEGTSDYKNYSAHRDYYESVLSPDAGGPPIVTYAHVQRDEDSNRIILQYWLFYYYNDWFNKHEGDWEMVQVILNGTAVPEWVVLSQHHGGTRRHWSTVQVEEETHPAVYVALGSHANYFCADEIYPNGTTVGTAQVEIMDRTGTFSPMIPDVKLIPDREEVELDPSKWLGLEWLIFEGHWGEVAPQGDFGGPLGPADKGEQWEQPYQWGMSQPLDTETWYKNRLRVQVRGQGTGDARVTLLEKDGKELPSAESMGSLAILHKDPDPEQVLVADLEVNSHLPYHIVATWPDSDAAEVTRYYFSNVPYGDSGHAVLTLAAETPPTLAVDGLPVNQSLTAVETEPATWDAPEVVWAAGLLTTTDLIRGLVICLLATYIPTIVYVTGLYHCDRYEKEPKRLLIYAFFWGAWPALLVAVAVRIFFQLPVDLLGQEAIEAVRAGFLSPLIEEAIKGVAVLYFVVRYRREFDDVLDGIIYGAIVGFGFAMTANMISYLGAFFTLGFAGLSTTIFIEGILYGLNHGLYTAIFGAGLGYARLVSDRWKRLVVPIIAFVLAVTVHAAHNLAIQNSIGLNPITVLLTWGGVLMMIVVIHWSLRLEKNCLQTELFGEVPDELYRRMITRGGRGRAQWRALRIGGWRGLRHIRRVHKMCAELAFKKKQYRLRPDEASIGEEASQLRVELQALIVR
jgi:RsiW-degrading membrane proteinase PrsW (M82 family)